MTKNPGKWSALALLALCQVAALSLWFSATAVVPALARDFGLSGFTQSLYTSAVQAGFVLGSLLSAFLGLADRLSPKYFFAVATALACLFNAAILLLEPGSFAVVACRLLTGFCMAGIYPVGMKMVSTWADRDMGLLVGILVGALTLGSATPHLFNALGGLDWRVAIAGASVSGGLAAALILLVRLGPRHTRAAAFKPGRVLEAWTNKALRLANGGYLGHMWELYAMWAWIGAFLSAHFLRVESGEAALFHARLGTFATIGIGLVGCVAAGWLADRIGRTWTTMGAMAVSGACALGIGFLFGGDTTLLLLVALIWGITIVADSAQFSASIAELAAPEAVGTMLTLQTSLGFALTLITIHLMPLWVDWLGWQWAFAPLALGPLLGIWSMARLRALPDSAKLANGKK